MPDSTWSDISEGKTIIFLTIEEGQSYGNAIYPGDRIDLYMKMVEEEILKNFLKDSLGN